jgi:hypothetical protein
MITTTRSLLTASWKADVQALESAIARFTLDRPLPDGCKVSFFEIAGDGYLHVNVTHRYKTATASGWAGPACLPQGFVHNRRFGDAPPTRVTRQIRNMVFADRID